jgi:hypothetical protein
MNDVPSYTEFTPRNFDSDIERSPPSCAEDSSFCDDTRPPCAEDALFASAPPRCRLVVAPAGPLSTFSRSAAGCPAPTALDTVDCRVNGCTLGVFLESSASPPTRRRASWRAPPSTSPPIHRRTSGRAPLSDPPPTRRRASKRAPSSAPPPTRRRASVVVAITQGSESQCPRAPPPASSSPSREQARADVRTLLCQRRRRRHASK